MAKIRVDDLLVEQGYFADRDAALRAVIAREVRVDDVYVSSAALKVRPDADLFVKNTKKFVSRGGHKLQGALDHFRQDVAGFRCVDVGSSTGGFSDCLLQAGAASVACVDVNYGHLNRDLLWILRMPREEATKYISEEEYDSLPWAWEKAGDPRWEVELIRRMAYGEGDLSVIAKGTLAMMEKFGLPKSWLDRTDGATNSNLIYNGFPNHHGPAEAWQVGMLYNLVYNRDCMIHEIVCETGSGAPYEVTKKVMEDFFGEGCYDKAKAYTPINENKAKLAAYCVNDKNFHDSATLCNWMWPMTQSPSKERAYHGDLDLQADFMTAVTGETYTQAGLQEAGERITQMLRAMTAISFQKNCGSANLRQEHDAICDWVFDKEPDFKAFEEGTTKLDRADMEKAKDLFYDIFGWDKTTGVPTRETLEKFDLGDMADDLEARGIYDQTPAGETAASEAAAQ